MTAPVPKKSTTFTAFRRGGIGQIRVSHLNFPVT